MTEGPVRFFRKSFDERLAAIGVACSATLGALLNLVDWASPGEAIVVALTGATLTFVVGAGLRAERRAELRGLIEAAPPPARPELERALQLTARIVERYPDRTARAELERRCRQFADDLEVLAGGQVHTEADESGQLVDRTLHCRRRMRAVTNVAEVGPDWWRSPIGRDYWRANLRALDRGVRITRVFIVADPADPDVAALLAEQRDAGVHTLVLDRSRARRDQLVNLVIWDEKRAWQAEMDPYGRISRNVFHHDPRTVGRLRDLADGCEATAAA